MVVVSFPPEELEIIKDDGAEERGENLFTKDSKHWMPKILSLQILGHPWGESLGLKDCLASFLF